MFLANSVFYVHDGLLLAAAVASAAELFWPVVSSAFVHYVLQFDMIVYEPGWEENEENIKVHFNGWEDGDPKKVKNLKEFKDGQKDKHKFYKDHFLLITRLFDNRVKAFINNILMSNEHVEHYSYRIGELGFYLKI